MGKIFKKVVITVGSLLEVLGFSDCRGELLPRPAYEYSILQLTSIDLIGFPRAMSASMVMGLGPDETAGRN